MYGAIDGDDNGWGTICEAYRELRALLPTQKPWPTIKELGMVLRGPEDLEFSSWVRAMPDKYWAKYDISAIRLGYELGRRVFAGEQR
jgi:hypothetical protein